MFTAERRIHFLCCCVILTAVTMSHNFHKFLYRQGEIFRIYVNSNPASFILLEFSQDPIS